MTYKPWKSPTNPQPVNEDTDASVKTVSGTTAKMMGDNGGSQLAEHAHSFEYSVTMNDGVAEVAGQTDEQDGHSHGISDSEKTGVSADGHYHLLPPSATQEYPGTGAGAKVEGFDLIGLLDGDNRALGEWLAKIVENPSKPTK